MTPAELYSLCFLFYVCVILVFSFEVFSQLEKICIHSNLLIRLYNCSICGEPQAHGCLNTAVKSALQRDSLSRSCIYIWKQLREYMLTQCRLIWFWAVSSSCLPPVSHDVMPYSRRYSCWGTPQRVRGLIWEKFPKIKPHLRVAKKTSDPSVVQDVMKQWRIFLSYFWLTTRSTLPTFNPQVSLTPTSHPSRWVAQMNWRTAGDILPRNGAMWEIRNSAHPGHFLSWLLHMLMRA